jgi:hypothetical protein
MRQLLLATAILIGILPHSARAQSCPTTLPVPATPTDIACFTVNKPVTLKCGTSLSPAMCNAFNVSALNNGLVTVSGYSYLSAIGFCAVVADIGIGPRIFDFCPMGCFAADAQIASTVTSDGRAHYVAAGSVTLHSSLMSMADEASIGDVVLAPQSVKRMVSGPESEPLVVFALANGRTLRVTSHHPMVLDSGEIIEASQVKSKMSFVGLDGRSVKVSAITREKPVADVFNFVTQGDTQLSHIIVAEGVLVGDLTIQDELASEESSIGLRR